MTEYLHGYSDGESERLRAQAGFLEPLLFNPPPLMGCANILELGSGVGAQTDLLLKHYPSARITSVERDPASHAAHQSHLSRTQGRSRVHAVCADVSKLPEGLSGFDGAYACWVLEHVPDPISFLQAARARLNSGAKLCAIEVQNSSLQVHPRPSPDFWRYYAAYNQLQTEVGGDPDVGMKLGHYLDQAGFSEIVLRPVFVHGDSRDASARRALFEFFGRLLRSGEQGLTDRRHCSAEDGARAAAELCELSTVEDSVLFYTAVMATARS